MIITLYLFSCLYASDSAFLAEILNCFQLLHTQVTTVEEQITLAKDLESGSSKKSHTEYNVRSGDLKNINIL